MTPILTFDLETVPDVSGLRRLLDLGPEMSDAAVAEAAFEARRQKTGGSDFLPHHQHRVLCISCALHTADGFRVFSLYGEDEARNIQRFFDGIERYTPTLVSWNGGGFDLPVLNYRGLVHGLRASRLWQQGEDDPGFKWNNYISRYHPRHTDLMDVLAMYGRGGVPLDELAQLLGFPGKLGMDGSKVWQAYQAGGLEDIRRYCETDVVNTHLVYLAFQHLRGHLSPAAWREQEARIRQTLEAVDEPHWREFLSRWAMRDEGGPAA
ncbi:MAG: 3'-5' exonuclease [Betaproteobacteria bacterium]|nr:3'-5' exonuclease [Betaproteobacteria bacterium]